ncbi:MAG: ATP-binding cassette domain-containing protein, partial [bacterium]
MSAPILQVQGVSKRFGGFVALDGIDLELGAGERLGLIGPNGSGKTTLINCISGALNNESGSIVFEGKDITRLPPHQRAARGLARSFQIPKPFRSMTVLQNLRVPLEYAAHGRTERRKIDEDAMEVLELIGLKSRADDSSAGLTQVDMRKLELARALAAKPKLLVSDEAMAGLSSSEVDEILEILRALNARGVAV